MKLALAQHNYIVGDLAGNVARIQMSIDEAAAAGCDAVVFSEMAITGYPPMDLLDQPSFRDDALAAVAALERYTARYPTLTVIVGGIDKELRDGMTVFFNSAYVLHSGARVAVYHKSLLPTYDVFDERRYFESGDAPCVVDIVGITCGITICEDIWNDRFYWPERRYGYDPVEDCVARGARMIINLSASPYHAGKEQEREAMVAALAMRHGVTVVYVNQVGGNDELIFDGHSFVMTPDGLHSRAPGFEDAVVVCEIMGSEAECLMSAPSDNAPPRTGSPPPSGGSPPMYIGGLARPGAEPATSILGAALRRGGGDHAAAPAKCPRPVHSPAGAFAYENSALLCPIEQSIIQALTLGVRDYTRKCGFKDVVVGLSGGIDSAVTAAIAVEALDREHVIGVGMPSKFSSQGSIDDARVLAQNLGIRFELIPIQPIADTFLQALGSVFAGTTPGVAEENIQARIRGTLLMALSNKFGSLLLTTGNKSEIAVGYCTLYGDMSGGLAVISDLSKGMVYRVGRYLNEQAGRVIIPESIFTKAPSAELRPNQTDQDTLPPYDILDQVIERYVERSQGLDDVVASGFDRVVVTDVIRMIDRNEYKRRQAAPGLRVTSKAFGVGRRMPIAARRTSLHL